MITINAETEDILLWAKRERYKPSSVDLTKEEMANEFVAGYIEEQIYLARLKEAKQAVKVQRPVVTVA